jgi:hypothetical protein
MIANAQREREEKLAERLLMEREWYPDRQAMLAALRVVLGLPPRPVSFVEEASS